MRSFKSQGMLGFQSGMPMVRAGHDRPRQHSGSCWGGLLLHYSVWVTQQVLEMLGCKRNGASMAEPGMGVSMQGSSLLCAH